MKVLHIPYGSPMIELCRALRRNGVQATSCHFNENTFQFKPDVCLKLNLLNANERNAQLKRFLQESIQKYDIFHFHFGETFFPDKHDLAQIKRAGKKMVVHHHGSDIRQLSIAKSFNNPYIKVKPEWTEDKIKKNLATLSAYIDHAIVQDHELETYISGKYKHVHVIPHAIDVNQFSANYPDGSTTSPPLVVHAPTARGLKGTEFVLNAVNELRRKGLPFQFKLIEGMTYEETKTLIAQADIVIDQLRIGACGYISSEAMASGKPVVCFVRDDLVAKYPPGLPVVNANPSTIIPVLENLIKTPKTWRELGIKGRKYIETFHHESVVAERYRTIYQSL